VRASIICQYQSFSNGSYGICSFLCICVSNTFFVKMPKESIKVSQTMTRYFIPLRGIVLHKPGNPAYARHFALVSKIHTTWMRRLRKHLQWIEIHKRASLASGICWIRVNAFTLHNCSAALALTHIHTIVWWESRLGFAWAHLSWSDRRSRVISHTAAALGVKKTWANSQRENWLPQKTPKTAGREREWEFYNDYTFKRAIQVLFFIKL